MGPQDGERGDIDGFGGALGFGAAVDGEEVDAGVLNGLDEVHRLPNLSVSIFVSLGCGEVTVNLYVS